MKRAKPVDTDATGYPSPERSPPPQEKDHHYFPGGIFATTALTALQPATSNLYAAETTLLKLRKHRKRARRLLPRACPVPKGDLESDTTNSSEKVLVLGKPLDNPFTSDEDQLPVRLYPLFDRPQNGQVNGYIKYNWPRKGQANQPLGPAPVKAGDSIQHISPPMPRLRPDCQSSSELYPDAAVSTTAQLYNRDSPSIFIMSKFAGRTLSQATKANAQSPLEDASAHAPPMLPPSFGLEGAMADMDDMGKKCWEFFLDNWVTGRCVLKDTNVWRVDFARMASNKGILYAFQSLAGVYIYDYVQHKPIRRLVNERYAIAVESFNELLNAPNTGRCCQVIITMTIILSMHDVILTERRLTKTGKSQWLEGFKLGEYLLQQIHLRDESSTSNSHPQYDQIHISQSIIVGRAVILAESMMELPDRNSMNPKTECNRFKWLLHSNGNGNDLSMIHGGCGFSKMLLHTWSQVTYCAARLSQEPGSTVIPVTAKIIERKLKQMSQWNREGKSLEEYQPRPETITRVRRTPDDFMISSKEEMTEVTAEAWRIAAMIYYQCRLLRLPRGHGDVLANMNDLAKCISIMPTSGSNFTAQAPLLPVFLLGLLSTTVEHKKISQRWFDEVLEIPVRSSVSQLYEALKRAWKWIDGDARLQHKSTPVPKDLGERDPWWESVVEKVREQEGQTLYLT